MEWHAGYSCEEWEQFRHDPTFRSRFQLLNEAAKAQSRAIRVAQRDAEIAQERFEISLQHNKHEATALQEKLQAQTEHQEDLLRIKEDEMERKREHEKKEREQREAESRLSQEYKEKEYKACPQCITTWIERIDGW